MPTAKPATEPPEVEATPPIDGPIEWSPMIGSLFPAMIAALGDMPTIRKDNTAEVIKDGKKLYSYNYADLGDTLDAVRPVLAAHGLAAIQPVVDAPDGTPIVTTMLIHVSGQWMRSTFAIRPASKDPQAIGSAITYARRYALSASLGLASVDDDGKAAGIRSPARAEAAPEPEPEPEWVAVDRIMFDATASLEDGPGDTVYKALTATLGRMDGDIRKFPDGSPELLVARAHAIRLVERYRAGVDAGYEPVDVARDLFTRIRAGIIDIDTLTSEVSAGIAPAGRMAAAAAMNAHDGPAGTEEPDEVSADERVLAREYLDQAWTETEDRPSALRRAAELLVEHYAGTMNESYALALVTVEADAQDAEDDAERAAALDS